MWAALEALIPENQTQVLGDVELFGHIWCRFGSQRVAGSAVALPITASADAQPQAKLTGAARVLSCASAARAADDEQPQAKLTGAARL